MLRSLLPVQIALILLAVACGSGTEGLPDASLPDASMPDASVPDGSMPFAPPIDRTVVTSVGVSTAFLYTGPNAVQIGVAPGTIDPLRVAVLRGRVVNLANQPLPGIEVRALGHGELGRTVTRADGQYDFALNGGGPAVLEFYAPGYPLVSRRMDTPWQDYIVLPDVALTPLDLAGTSIDMTAATSQVARASTTTDAQGDRRPTLLFKPGTTATMILDGGSAPLPPPWTVRATEYTVGAGGRAAMPGTLPPTSGYTFAAELSIDEALAAGATGVQFSQPVIVYVENFIHMPVGATVPSGSLDRTTGRWVPEPDGRALKILSIAGGVASIDADGDGAADDDTALTALGIDMDERARLGGIYAAGQELWRVPTHHFSACDYNSPDGPPAGALPPAQPDYKPIEHACDTQGSIVACQEQVLKEAAIVAGTPYHLRYSSERVPGHGTGNDLVVRVTTDVVPNGLKGIAVQASVAGRLYEQYYSPGSDPISGVGPIVPNISWTIPWDGLDAYGRAVQGGTPIFIRTNYVYPAVRYETNDKAYQAFGGYADPNLPYPALNACVTIGINGHFPDPYASPWCGFNLKRDELRGVSVWDAREANGLGGWALDVHHSYDPVQKAIRLGDGTTERSNAAAAVVKTVAGGGSKPFPAANGGPALSADLDQLEDVAVGPDGTIFGISSHVNNPGGLRRVGRDGKVFAIAELANIAVPTGLAVDENGRVYVCGRDGASNGVVVRVDPDGTVTPIAGRAWQGGPFPTPDTLGDGAAAIDAILISPVDLAIGPDGALYVADSGSNGAPLLGRVRRIELARGTIDTVAGGGVDARPDEDLDPGEAALDHSLDRVSAIAFDGQGRMYLAMAGANTVVRIDIDGRLTRFAGTGVAGTPNPGFPPLNSPFATPSDLAVGLDGTVYIRARHTGPNASTLVLAIHDGRTEIVAGVIGTKSVTSNSDGAPATNAVFPGDHGLAISPDGALYLRTRFVIYRVGPRFAGFGSAEQVATSPNGDEIWVFDAEGRHLRTVDSVTGVVLRSFGYDAAGHLSSVTDSNQRVTTIERDGRGWATAIVAPGGARTELALNSEGYLATLRDSAGAEMNFTYGVGGLLTGLVDRRGGQHTFAYDGDGRLTQDDGPANHHLQLSRVQEADKVTVTANHGNGRFDIYFSRRNANGDIEATLTDQAGAFSSYVLQPDGTEIITRADGVVETTSYGPDPRFGLQVPRTTSVETLNPSGRKSVLTISRSAPLTDPLDPFSFSQLVDSYSLDGHASSVTYSKSQQTLSVRSAGDRRLTIVQDTAGRETSATWGSSRTPLTRTYDSLGRLTTVTRGSDVGTVVYDGRDRPTTVTDPSGLKLDFAYDAADRLQTITDGLGGAHGTVYDAEGDVIAFTEPSGAYHGKVRDGEGALIAYLGPGHAAQWNIARDPEGVPTSFNFAAGRMLTISTDTTTGRRTALTGPSEELRYGYSDLTLRPTDLIVDRAGTAQDQRLQTVLDGDVATQITFSGAANADFGLTYDLRGNLTSRHLVSGSDDVTTAFAYDADDFRTQEGPFTFTRGGALAEVTRITDSVMTLDTVYDPAGRATTRTATVGAAAIYKEQLTYDGADRITQRTETIGGVASQLSYGYDAAGRLTSVQRDGSASETSSYDSSGNRLSRTRPSLAGTESMTYDPKGTLATRGSTTYTFDASGILSARGSDVFTFGDLRRLERAVVGATTIDYAFDPLGRRCARTIGTQTQEFFYADPENPWMLTASRAPGGQLTQYFHDPDGRLIALQQGATRFYVATDVAGTPRLVTDGTGAVVKRIEYDAYGDQISDSAPTFDLPVGYAGGLRDPDTGLIEFGVRQYDPAAGSWTSRDPILDRGGQSNLYAYVGGDPVNQVDPDGLFLDLFRKKWGPRYDKFKELFGHAKNTVDKVDEAARSAQRIADTNESDRPVTAFDCFLKYLSKLPGVGDAFGVPRDALQVGQDKTREYFAPGGNFNRAARARDSGE